MHYSYGIEDNTDKTSSQAKGESMKEKARRANEREFELQCEFHELINAQNYHSAVVDLVIKAMEPKAVYEECENHVGL